jgi:AraC family transcriptional regulator
MWNVSGVGASVVTRAQPPMLSNPVCGSARARSPGAALLDGAPVWRRRFHRAADRGYRAGPQSGFGHSPENPAHRIARRVPEGKSEDERFELTDHARRWIETIWGPLQRQGHQLLKRHGTKDLSVFARLLAEARAIQEVHAERIHALLDEPLSRGRPNRLRGGLSPAALRRVELFVEANLSQPIRLPDVAERAALSAYHFARAFKTSTGTTPRAFIEQRRIEKAKQLLRESVLPLADIALEAGLGTQSRFTTAFRRTTGFTPAVYRNGAR